jgi:hypothetical protein
MQSLAYSQVVFPIGTTGYNIDAVAENTTATGHTSQAIDGSDYVMYSQAYGALFSSAGGLPNNGVVASGTRTYQLQSYSVTNVLYCTAGQMDTIVFAFPVPYAALSLLNFATEGSATMNATVRFTDNTTQVFTNLSVPDWFGTGNSVIAGFDRCGRSSGTPAFNTVNPKLFYTDLVISCANRAKSVAKVIVHNAGTSGRLCVMAVSGAGVPVFSASMQPVTCSGGSNGSATIIATDGFGPFGYTVNTMPPQYSANILNVPTGVYSYTAQDAGNCPVTSTFAVTQSLITQPVLSVTATSTVICAGATVTLTSSGASTYTWNGTGAATSTVITPQSTAVYTVNGTTSANCQRSGTVEVKVNPLPVISLTPPPASLCVNSGTQALSAAPTGGSFSGTGVTGGAFDPALSGTGTFNIHTATPTTTIAATLR